MPDDSQKLLDKREVAAMLKVSDGTVDNLVARGEFPVALKIGSSARWLESDVREYLQWQDWKRKLARREIQGEEEEPKEAQSGPIEPNQTQTRPKRPKP